MSPEIKTIIGNIIKDISYLKEEINKINKTINKLPDKKSYYIHTNDLIKLGYSNFYCSTESCITINNVKFEEEILHFNNIEELKNELNKYTKTSYVIIMRDYINSKNFNLKLEDSNDIIIGLYKLQEKNGYILQDLLGKKIYVPPYNPPSTPFIGDIYKDDGTSKLTPMWQEDITISSVLGHKIKDEQHACELNRLMDDTCGICGKKIK